MLTRRRGPFRLQEKRQGRVTAAKTTATSLLLWNSEITLCGTSEGQIILSNSSTSQQVVVLKPKRPVTKMIKVFNNTALLALCGGEVYCFMMINNALTRHNLLALQSLTAAAMVVVDICVNQRGPPDWGLCIVTQDLQLHLYSSFSSFQRQYEHLRTLKCNTNVGANVQTCWYENVICLGGNNAVMLIPDDDDDNESTALGKQRKVSIDMGKDSSSCATVCILPLPEGQILISTGLLGVLVDLAGQPVHNQQVISYRSPPLSLLCSGPYVITLCANNQVDISRTDAPSQIVQRIVLANVAPCLASANTFVFGELLYLIEQEEEIPCAFAVGLSLQHSETPYRIAEPVKLEDRLKELFEDDDLGDDDDELAEETRQDLGSIVQSALTLVRDSFPPSCLDKVKAMERYVYKLAGETSLTRNQDARVAFDYFLQAEVNPLHFLRDTESANVDDVIDYSLRWRKALSTDSTATVEVDTALVQFLCRKHKVDQLERFCLDVTNTCELHLVLEAMNKSVEFKLAATHLKSLRSSSSEDTSEILLCYQQLNQPTYFCNLLLRPGASVAATSIVPYLVWMLNMCEFDLLIAVFKRYGKELAGYVNDDDIVLKSSVARPRYILAVLGEFQQEKPTNRFAQQIIAALEESALVQTITDPGVEELRAMLRTVVQQDSDVANASVDLLQHSPHKSHLARERIDCLLALHRHDEALRIYVHELKDFQGAETYCLATSNNEAFTCLLRILLEFDLDRALVLLNRQADRVNALEAMRALPNTVPVHAAQAFLLQAINQSVHDTRNARVEKNLAKSAHFKAKLALMNKQKQYVKLELVDRCSKCDNKFTDMSNGGIVRLPSGSVQHCNCPPPPRPSVRPATPPSADAAVTTQWKQLH